MNSKREKLLTIMDNLFQQLKGKRLYPYQKRLFQSNKRFKIVNKSRQVGISYALACYGLLNALLLDKIVLIVSPSERQSKHVMDYVREFLNHLKNDFNISFQEETKTSYIFTGGGAIYSFPNNSNAIRGYPADIIIIDEFAHFLNNTDKDIVTAITPSVVRNPSCEVFYVSTPFGTKNLFYDYWHNRDDFEKILINYKDCPDLKINPDDFDTLTFQQEFNNQFIEDNEESEFPFELIKQCIDPELTYQDLRKDRVYIGGADIGRHQDLTACTVLEKNNDRFILRSLRILKQKPYREQEEYFTYLLSNYNFQSFNIDASGIGNNLAENLRGRFPINPVTFSNETKQQMVLTLKRLMEDKRLVIPNDPILINSIRMIRRKYTESNYLKFDAPRDKELGHADAFWALALAVMNEGRKRVLPLIK